VSRSVIIYQLPRHHRASTVCSAMYDGLKVHGENVTVKPAGEYHGVEAEISVFYGFEGPLRRLIRDHVDAQAHAIYVDLGYWKRKEQHDKWNGYHKLVINDRHPTSYFQRRPHDNRRVAQLGLEILPWKTPNPKGHILVAGMGAKGAEAEDFDPEEWERGIIKSLQKYAKAHQIVYRPKPSDKRARPIPGVGYSPPSVSVERALKDCYAVVTHHSNVAVDAILAGIPAFCWKGVAAPMSSQDISQIEDPRRPEGREQWANDISYTQWNVYEMRSGLAWEALKMEGVLP